MKFRTSFLAFTFPLVSLLFRVDFVNSINCYFCVFENSSVDAACGPEKLIKCPGTATKCVAETHFTNGIAHGYKGCYWKMVAVEDECTIRRNSGIYKDFICACGQDGCNAAQKNRTLCTSCEDKED